MECNHNCALYTYTGHNDKVFWFVKCSKCNFRTSVNNTEHLAIICWKESGLTEYTNWMQGELLVREIEEICRHLKHKYFSLSDGYCFCYCPDCMVQTPIVEDIIIAETLWHKKFFVKFDYDFLKYHFLLVRILDYTNFQLKYVQSMFGLVAAKYKKLSVLKDINIRITRVLKACSKGLGDVVCPFIPQSVESITVDVKVTKIDSGKLTVFYD